MKESITSDMSETSMHLPYIISAQNESNAAAMDPRTSTKNFKPKFNKVEPKCDKSREFYQNG
jgi:hypothetical protein